MVVVFLPRTDTRWNIPRAIPTDIPTLFTTARHREWPYRPQRSDFVRDEERIFLVLPLTLLLGGAPPCVSAWVG